MKRVARVWHRLCAGACVHSPYSRDWSHFVLVFFIPEPPYVISTCASINLKIKQQVWKKTTFETSEPEDHFSHINSTAFSITVKNLLCFCCCCFLFFVHFCFSFMFYSSFATLRKFVIPKDEKRKTRGSAFQRYSRRLAQLLGSSLGPYPRYMKNIAGENFISWKISPRYHRVSLTPRYFRGPSVCVFAFAWARDAKYNIRPRT